MHHRADPSRLPDEALLAGLGAGDRDLAAAFVRRYQRRVFGLAFTVLGDETAAADVAQATFTRAWERASSYDPRRASAATWLLTIARNLAIDELRRRRPLPVAPDDAALIDRAAQTTAPPDAVVAREDAAAVLTALAALPERDRRALVLSAWCGRTAVEIGEIESIPTGTAKTRIRRALIGLRAARDGAEVDA